ncbi:transcriptional repressor MarR [Weissella oryzae SG25]|uniref:Transcriptional repressor MarR n=1 Tax=Weissella oryzae (strain DSM 25784 / JCM 18191 / LMG 30913 / SG25) TaxID=1329250 RepID=A0A069CRP1_WEIOS|nr:MarR family transcriptional regulator [Weissella oryzae]GAK30069.1 transcriptional repressor MarR [Weissella oryzae SG25]
MQNEEVAKQLDRCLNEIHLAAENKREVLVAPEEIELTNTQGHILMLLAQNGPQTNAELARTLAISPAAMTKAMKSLNHRADPVVSAISDPEDARIKRWSLTHTGVSLAQLHEKDHQNTRMAYVEMLNDFPENEVAVISRFLTELEARCVRG